MTASQEAPRSGLNVGIMCRGTTFPKWQAEAITRLRAVPGVTLALLIVDGGVSSPSGDKKYRRRLESAVPGGSRLKALAGRLRRYAGRNGLWQLYVSASQGLRPVPCDEPVDLSRELEGVPSIVCRPVLKGRFSQYFTEPDVNAIKGYGLDVILRFAFGIIRGDVLGTARHGVWSYHHDDHLKYRGGPPGFWELYFGDKISGAILQQLTDRLDDGAVIRKGSFDTILHSYNLNRSQLYMGSVRWPAEACESLLAGNESELFAEPGTSDAPIRRAPTNWQMLAYGVRLGKRLVLKQFRDLLGKAYVLVPTWAIAAIGKPVQELVSQGELPEVDWLEPPADRFFADPFAVACDDVMYVFFEDYDNRKRRGRISVAETRDLRHFGNIRPVLEKPFHLSYPFVVEHQGRYFMIPEQHETHQVDIYEADPFPDRWVKRSTLVPDFSGVDPTVLRHGGKWWMFLGNVDDDDKSRLYLFHAPDLFGPWAPHRNNPVKTEYLSTRPAGTPFYLDGRLIRPTQDCRETYGGALILNEITSMSEDCFEERPVVNLQPNRAGPYAEGLHTLTAVGEATLIDGKAYIWERNRVDRALAAKARTLIRVLSSPIRGR